MRSLLRSALASLALGLGLVGCQKTSEPAASGDRTGDGSGESVFDVTLSVPAMN
jgi:hypothetical protein